MRTKSILTLLAASAFLLSVSACGDKNPADAHATEVVMTYTPNPATVNTAISFEFEVTEDGVEVTGLAPHVEVVMQGMSDHNEMMVEEEAGGHGGHYGGTHTFAMAGTYDIHFEFTHDEELADEEFSLTVQ